jgi:hypothetical protein
MFHSFKIGNIFVNGAIILMLLIINQWMWTRSSVKD